MVAYGISINLVEVTWKGKIKAQFPNPNEYSSFMGDFSSATGAVTFIMMLLSRYIFKKFGWGVAAKITPTVLLITGDPPTPPRMAHLHMSACSAQLQRYWRKLHEKHSPLGRTNVRCCFCEAVSCRPPTRTCPTSTPLW